MPSRLALLFLFPKNIAVRKSLLLTTLVEHGAFLECYILFPAGKCVDFSCFGNRILPCYRAGLHTVAQAGLELMALFLPPTCHAGLQACAAMDGWLSSF